MHGIYSNVFPFVTARRGAKGDTGDPGATGNSILIIDKQLTEQVLAVNNTTTTLSTFTLNKSTPTDYRLLNDGDSYEIIAQYRNTGNGTASVGSAILNSTSIGSGNFIFFEIPATTEVRVRILITRLSATTVFASIEIIGQSVIGPGVYGYGGDVITVPTLASNTFTVELQGYKDSSSNLAMTNAIVKYLKFN